VGLAPTGKRRLVTAHTHKRHSTERYSITTSAMSRRPGGVVRPNVSNFIIARTDRRPE
jgi:hypothetical protein